LLHGEVIRWEEVQLSVKYTITL